MKVTLNVLQRASTCFNVLQRASTWLVLCLLSFYFSSCHNDVQIVPNDSKTEQLSSEVKAIKAQFENNAQTSNLVNCNSNKKIQPRWDKSR